MREERGGRRKEEGGRRKKVISNLLLTKTRRVRGENPCSIISYCEDKGSSGKESENLLPCSKV